MHTEPTVALTCFIFVRCSCSDPTLSCRSELRIGQRKREEHSDTKGMAFDVSGALQLQLRVSIQSALISSGSRTFFPLASEQPEQRRFHCDTITQGSVPVRARWSGISKHHMTLMFGTTPQQPRLQRKNQALYVRQLIDSTIEQLTIFIRSIFLHRLSLPRYSSQQLSRLWVLHVSGPGMTTE